MGSMLPIFAMSFGYRSSSLGGSTTVGQCIMKFKIEEKATGLSGKATLQPVGRFFAVSGGSIWAYSNFETADLEPEGISERETGSCT